MTATAADDLRADTLDRFPSAHAIATPTSVELIQEQQCCAPKF
jgi:hypothetical protein